MEYFFPRIPKILIVDDNPKNLEVLGKLLREHNFHVEFAIDGLSALEWIEHAQFDIMLLDINMPNLNGFEVCKLIRNNNHFQNLPIIFLSTVTEKDSICKGFELGAQDYITKPFDFREIMARVKIQLDLKFSKEQLILENHLLKSKVIQKTTALERSNEELTKAYEALKESDKVKAEFLKIIGHEIRTPLEGIIGLVKLLKSELRDNKLSDIISTLEDSVSRLEKFTLTALTIAELKTGKRNMSFQEFSLHELIQDSIRKLYQLSISKKIKFNIILPDDIVIKGDTLLLKMCFNGIIENAIEFSPIDGTVSIQIEDKKNGITCEISDEGPGFSESAMENLFKLFGSGESHFGQNVGLDLFLARIIMEAHSGNIVVENLKNRGAVIRLMFPPKV